MNQGMISGMKNAAKYVGVSPRLLFTWVSQGHVKCYRHSKRKLFFRPSDLIRAVEQLSASYEARSSS